MQWRGRKTGVPASSWARQVMRSWEVSASGAGADSRECMGSGARQV